MIYTLIDEIIASGYDKELAEWSIKTFLVSYKTDSIMQQKRLEAAMLLSLALPLGAVSAGLSIGYTIIGVLITSSACSLASVALSGLFGAAIVYIPAIVCHLLISAGCADNLYLSFFLHAMCDIVFTALTAAIGAVFFGLAIIPLALTAVAGTCMAYFAFASIYTIYGGISYALRDPLVERGNAKSQIQNSQNTLNIRLG
jgi:hypothetical protein